MLAFQGAIKGLSHAEADRRARHWCKRLELGPWQDKKVEELSKGMAQKVQFIAAVLPEPELLILDEPFSGMDPVNQDVFRDLIVEMNRSGSTVVFSTHVMESAERLCSEIALIDRGRVVLDGSIASIKRRFGANTIRMEIDGHGSFLRGLPGVDRVDDSGRYVELRLAAETDEQSILRAAVERVRVRRFEIVAPSLHNIFVQQVGRERDDA
jgi:ABC-2 type transport system ATP-binding protein